MKLRGPLEVPRAGLLCYAFSMDRGRSEVQYALAVAGCSDNTKQDLAACKVKAMDRYELKLSSTKNEDEAAYYVQIYMKAAGYKLWPPSCNTTTGRWIYHRKTSWERWKMRDYYGSAPPD